MEITLRDKKNAIRAYEERKKKSLSLIENVRNLKPLLKRMRGRFASSIVNRPTLQKWAGSVRSEQGVLRKYDRMAGDYVAGYHDMYKDEGYAQVCIFDGELDYRKISEMNDRRIREIAGLLKELGISKESSLLEVGAGELTTIVPLAKEIPFSRLSALELSWSRLAVGKLFANEQGITLEDTIAASALDLPFPDNSYDYIYTSHCLEQIGKGAERAIQEMHRVARKYIVLLEPGLEFASAYQKKANKRAGRVGEIDRIIRRLGYNLVRHGLFPFALNPGNKTVLYVIKKDSPESNPIRCVCPCDKAPLELYEQIYFCKKCGVVFPIVKGIPFLRKEDGLLATKFDQLN